MPNLVQVRRRGVLGICVNYNIKLFMKNYLLTGQTAHPIFTRFSSKDANHASKCLLGMSMIIDPV